MAAVVGGRCHFAAYLRPRDHCVLRFADPRSAYPCVGKQASGSADNGHRHRHFRGAKFSAPNTTVTGPTTVAIAGSAKPLNGITTPQDLQAAPPGVSLARRSYTTLAHRALLQRWQRQQRRGFSRRLLLSCWTSVLRQWREVSRDPQVKNLLDDVVGTNVAPSSLAAPSDNAVVLVVQAADVQALQRELNAYLRNNNIDSQPISRSEFLALNIPHEKQLRQNDQLPGSEAAKGSNAAGSELRKQTVADGAGAGGRAASLKDARLLGSGTTAANSASRTPEPNLELPTASDAVKPGATSLPSPSPVVAMADKSAGQVRRARQQNGGLAETPFASGTLYIARRLTDERTIWRCDCLTAAN